MVQKKLCRIGFARDVGCVMATTSPFVARPDRAQRALTYWPGAEFVECQNIR